MIQQTTQQPLWLQYSRLCDLPAWDDGLNWLSGPERVECDHWRSPIRRQAWLSGRWIAKQMVCQRWSLDSESMPDISIRSIDQNGQAVRPSIEIQGVPETAYCLSITHTEKAVLVALSNTSATRVGIDLCDQKDLPDSFAQTWFTPLERQQLDSLAADPDAYPHEAVVEKTRLRTNWITKTWATKESIYKAYNRGEPFAPLQIEVFWDAKTPVCRYGDHLFGDELQLTTWNVDNHIAVSAVIVESTVGQEMETFLRESIS